VVIDRPPRIKPMASSPIVLSRRKDREREIEREREREREKRMRCTNRRARCPKEILELLTHCLVVLYNKAYDTFVNFTLDVFFFLLFNVILPLRRYFPILYVKKLCLHENHSDWKDPFVMSSRVAPTLYYIVKGINLFKKSGGRFPENIRGRYYKLCRILP